MSRIILRGGSAEIVEKKSRFIAVLSPISDEQEAADFLAAQKKQYWDARHSCHAYVIGAHNEITHCSDDGEPSGTAGKPMLAVLTGADLRNCIAVVTRYFGGVLLGTGGLARAYTCAVQEALKACETGIREEGVKITIRTGYSQSGAVSYLLASGGYPVLRTDYSDSVTTSVLVPMESAAALKKAVIQRTSGQAEFPGEEPLSYALTSHGPVILQEGGHHLP